MRPSLPSLLVSAILLLIVCGVAALAQSPRMSLIEEGTNASCPPCAAQNPTFEKYLVKPHIASRVIPLVYHSSWPGRDPMYSANTVMHTGRIVGYYAINGVPTITVNGKFPTRVTGGWDGAPADTTAINNSLATATPMSPLTISVSEVVTGADVAVTVQVNSAEAMSNKKLHIAVVEGYHYYANAGTNGEKEFPYIARLMLPDHLGTSLSLGIGETKTFNQSFRIDTSWNASEMYVVAFVQDDATKEVLQAGSDKLELTLNSGAVAQLNSAAGQPGEFSTTLQSPVAGEYTVSLASAMPAGWTAELLVDGALVTPPATLSLAKDVPLAVKVRITPNDSKNRLGSATVTVTGPILGGRTSSTFRLYARDIEAFVMVKDEGNEQIAQYYQAALDKSLYSYALAPSGDELGFDLKTFGVVVCEVGKTTLSQSDVQVLKSYIDAGGRLFMIGAEIGWGLADDSAGSWGAYRDVAFLTNYLHATYVRDDNPATTIKGVTGDPIGDGINISFTTGIQNQDTPDEFAPLGGAVPVFTYGSTAAVAGIRYEDAKNRLVFFGFGLEGIGVTISRGEILRRGIAWLLGTTGVDDAVSGAPAAFDLYPNPASDRIMVPVGIASASRLRVSLHDLMGREVAVLADREAAPGRETLVFDASTLAPGSYAIRVTVDGTTSSRLLTIAR